MDLYNVAQPALAIANLFAALNTTAEWVELGLGIVVIAIAVASLNFWYMAFKRLKGDQELIPYQRSESTLGFIDLVAIFVCWLGSQVAVGVVLVAIAGPGAVNGGEAELFAEHGVLLLYLSAGTGLASLFIGGAYLVLRYRTTNSFGLRLGELKKQIGYGVVVFTMLFPVTLLVQFLLSLLVEYDHPVLSVLAENPSFVSIFGCWAAAVLAAPFVEEFLFRGVFQHWMERLSVEGISDQVLTGGENDNPKQFTPSEHHMDEKEKSVERTKRHLGVKKSVAEFIWRFYPEHVPDLDNPYQTLGTPISSGVADQPKPHRRFAYWPILVSSLCFALVHLGQGLAPIPLFILALGLGYLFRQTGSLIACITVHFLLNFYSMLVFTIMILLGETP